MSASADDSSISSSSMRGGTPGNGIDGRFRIAGLEGQHFQRIPAEDALGRCEVGLAPIRIDLGIGRAAAQLDVGQGLAHAVGQALRQQRRHADGTAFIDQAGDRIGQAHAGIAQQAAPVAGVMAAVAQVAGQIKIAAAARAQEHGRCGRIHARAVGGDEEIGLQALGILAADFVQAG